MSQQYIKKLAESFADVFGKRDSVPWVTAHDGYLVGWSVATSTARRVLQRQFEGCQPGTLVSYAIAADVLRLDLKAYEDHGWEKK